MKNSLFRKGLVLGIIILFIGASVIPSTVGINEEKQSPNENKTSFMGFNSRGDILYVGGGGPGNYSKIQDAINDSSDGDTVFVYDDSSPYYEYIVVNKAINLIGEDKNTTIIDGENKNSDNFAAVMILKDYTNITGFTIRNGKSTWNSAGVYLQSNYSTISNNIITNNSCRGIILWNMSNNNTIHDNIISNNGGYGIIMLESEIMNNHVISNNLIRDDENGVFIKFGLEDPNAKPHDDNKIKIICNIFVNLSESSIHLFNSSGNQVSDNTIIHNISIENINQGIYAFRSCNTSISNNQIIFNLALSGNEYHNPSGLWIYDCSNVSIAYNSISGSACGVEIWSSDTINLTGNLFSKCLFGINIGQNRNVTLVGNTITNCILGMKLYHSGNLIKENNFQRNIIHAIFECRPDQMNYWQENYWGRPRSIPKPIFGLLFLESFPIPWVEFDWNPAQEPYEIKGGN